MLPGVVDRFVALVLTDKTDKVLKAKLPLKAGFDLAKAGFVVRAPA